MTHHLHDRLHSGALRVVDVHATLWHSGVSWWVTAREGWWSAHRLRQGAQPLPSGTPLPRGRARVMDLGAKPPRGPEEQPKRARGWDISWSLRSS
jgi:hypothetical protein